MTRNALSTARAILRLLIVAAALFAPAGARAAGVYDLNPANGAPPPIPTVIGAGDSPVHITNTTMEELRGEATIDSLRIGQRAAFALGFDAANVASGQVGLNVLGDASVAGELRVGTAGRREGDGSWIPRAATRYASGLGVAGALSVERGGLLLIEGGSEAGGGGEGGEGGSAVEHSGVAASRVRVDGGSVVINAYGELLAGVAGTDASAPALSIANGGSVTVNAGLPPRDLNETASADAEAGAAWEFKGLGVGAGGIDIGAGGVLASGVSGGTIDGAAGSAILVRRGGMLDVSRGDMLARGIERVAVDGTYRAGVGNQLTAESGTLVFGAGSTIALSTDLYRLLNNDLPTNAAAQEERILARAGDIVLANPNPVLRTGMGFYTLETVPFETPPPEDPGTGDPGGGEAAPALLAAGSGSALRVARVDRAVVGSGTAADRALFHSNLDTLWGTPLHAAQAETIYDLHASGYPALKASGDAGELNKNVLESLMNGPGAGVSGGGSADRGLFELYSGASQWGAANVAFNTAGLFMAGLDRRVHRIGAELDRQGYAEYGAVLSDAAQASPLYPGDAGRRGRFWKGSLFSEENAETDGGVSGYSYRPRGVILGYDYTLGRFSLGAAAAYTRGDFDDSAAEADNSRIHSYSGGLFAAYHGDQGFNASAFATASVLDNNLSDTRGGMRRDADFTSRAYAVGGRLGYDMALADRIVLQPSVGLVHTAARAESHDESLNGVQVMRVGEVRRNSTLAPVDVAVGFDLLKNFDSLLRLNLNAGYAYAFGDAAPEGFFTYSGLPGAPAVDIARREAGRHRISLGAGLIFTKERFDLSARYDYTRADGQAVHQANTSAGLKF